MGRHGSLCSGYGGLDDAVRRVLGGGPAWFAEIDPAASKVLAHHWPDVPNHGDITSIDWAQVEPVEVLTAGFPCQDLSLAGARKGLRSGTRSGLWAHVARAINDLRPPLVFLENVRGLLSAGADSDMEPCPWCLGDAGGQHALRALGAVLGDLASLGYDARWCGLRAADVGAPHGRFRVFVTAWPATNTNGSAIREQPVSVAGCCGASVAGFAGTDPAADTDDLGRSGSGRTRNRWTRPAHGGIASPYADRPGHEGPESTAGHELPTRGAAPDTASEGRGLARGVAPGSTQGTVREEGWAAGRGGGTSAADTASIGRSEGRPQSAGLVGGPDVAVGSDAPASHADLDEQSREWPQQPGRDAAAGSGPVDWGTYAPAVARWEAVLGRRAPAPTITGTRGQPKLSPFFVEWMQGLDEGHVTAVPGLTTNDMLRLLGNGVVPQQGAAALSWLLAFEGVAA